jgi:HEPN domain-containing protein
MNAPEALLWLSFSLSDLQAAQKLLEDPQHYPRQVCFLSQQSAEKALKAVLVYLEIDFPLTHDLDRLREMIPVGWKVKEQFPQLYGLTIWAIESRYPGDMPDVTDSDAQSAVQAAGAIYQVIEEDFHLMST